MRKIHLNKPVFNKSLLDKSLLNSIMALLIFAAPAAFAESTTNPSGRHVSGSGAAKATTGMARTHVRGDQVGSRARPIGGSNAAGFTPQNSDEGRTSGGGGSGGM